MLDLQILDFSLGFLASSKDYCIARKFPTICRPTSAPVALNVRLVDSQFLDEYDLVNGTQPLSKMLTMELYVLCK